MTCLFIIFLGNSQYSFKCLKICLNTRWLMLEGTFSTSKALSVNLIFYLTYKSRCFALQASLSLLSHFLSLCDHNPLYLGFPQERVWSYFSPLQNIQKGWVSANIHSFSLSSPFLHYRVWACKTGLLKRVSQFKRGYGLEIQLKWDFHPVLQGTQEQAHPQVTSRRS